MFRIRGLPEFERSKRPWKNVQNEVKKLLTPALGFETLRAHTEQISNNMRTKTLLLTAALAVAGASTSMAQSNVYSVNVVGYINVPVLANQFYLVENPFNNSVNNTVTNVFPFNDTFDSTLVYTFDPISGLTPVETFIGGFGWFPGTNVLNPGTGFYLYPTTNSTITFTGSVQTNSSKVLKPGFNLVGSAYPGSLDLTALGIHGVDSDLVYRFTNGGLNNIITFIGGFGWFDDSAGGGGPTNGPTPRAAEAFFYFNANASNTWNQAFSIQ